LHEVLLSIDRFEGGPAVEVQFRGEGTVAEKFCHPGEVDNVQCPFRELVSIDEKLPPINGEAHSVFKRGED